MFTNDIKIALWNTWKHNSFSLKVSGLAIGMACSLLTFHYATDFAYRINPNGWDSPLPGFLLLYLLFSTVSIQVIKAAVMQPVNNLRTK